MKKILFNILFSTTIFSTDSLYAMIDADEADIELSKRSFLISGVPYEEKNKGNGVMTLCFKDSTSDHVALVFEMFHSSSPNDISVYMIHYNGEIDCFFCGNRRPHVENAKSTLINAYRGLTIEQKLYLPAEYIRFASWVLPKEDLIKGYECAIEDKRNSELCNSYTSISYVQRIMGYVLNAQKN